MSIKESKITKCLCANIQNLCVPFVFLVTVTPIKKLKKHRKENDMKEHDATEIAFKNGYKKAAEEIFEELERLHLHITNEFDLRRYNELKKKYTED